jgi:sugar lactone lactonase YvrE
LRSILALGMLATGLSGCGGFATPPAVSHSASDAMDRRADRSDKRFAVRGTLYVLTQQQAYPGIAGGLQAYTGYKPRLLGGIDGPASGINSPIAVATDTRGNIFVANGFGDDSCGTCAITEYAKGQYGDVAPVATISDSGWINGVSIDTHGNVYVAGQLPKTTNGVNGVYKYSGGSYGLSRQLDPAHQGSGIALDSQRRIYLSTIGNGYGKKGAVEVFAAGTKGSSHPIGTITGPDSQFFLPQGIAIDASGAIYVAQYDGDAITVYAPGTTNGDATPIRTISGDKTRIAFPSSLSIDKNGNLYVCDAGSPNLVLVFAPGAKKNVAPIEVFTSPPLQYAPLRATVFPESAPGP